MKRLTLLVSLILLGCSSAFAACTSSGTTLTAASTSSTDVAACFSAATASTTLIIIPSGTSNWTSQINFTVPSGSTSLTIQGSTTVNCTGTAGTSGYTCAPTDSTIIEDGDTTDTNCLLCITTAASGSFFRITGLTIEGGSGGIKNNGVLALSGYSQSTRVDHSHFNGQSYSPANNGNLVRYTSWLYGVFDHNLMDLAGIQNSVSVWYDQYNNDTAGFGDDAWHASTGLGTSTFLFVESNEFDTTSTGANGPPNDCSHGGKFVWRYNTNLYTSVQTHPTGGSGRARGCRAWEVYNNYFQGNNTGGGVDANFNLFFISSGTGLVWGNTVTGTGSGSGSGYTNFVTIHSDRIDNSTYGESPTPAGWGYCGTSSGLSGDGSPWDGANPSGYPCLDQPGSGIGDLLQGQFPNACDVTSGQCAIPNYNGSNTNQAREPIYEWLDSWSLTGGAGGTYWANYEPSVLTSNTDFYLWCNASSASGCTTYNATVGTGSGLLSARPSTCTAGVGYWATDTGTLYVCGASNAWSSYYTPYTYPHPLTVPAVSPVITLNDAVNVGCTTSSGLCAGAGLNMGQSSGAFPQFKNLLEFANPGFEPPLVQQIFQFAVNPCTSCTLTTFQWNVSNTNFTDYTSNQWVNASFVVSGNCYSGMTGCTGGGTADPASGCIGTIASSTAATGGFGSIFTINTTTNQGVAGCAGPLGIPGQVITISTNGNMTNLAAPSTTGWPQATLSGTVTAENSDLCAGCGTQAVDFNGASSLTLSNTAYTTLGVEKTITLNGNYTISFMAKSVSGSTSALTFTLTTRNGNCANPSPCTYTPTLTTSWAQYSHTFALTETPSPSDPFSIGVTFAVSSGAHVRFDNVAFTDPSTNPTAFSDTFVNTLKAYCQSAVNTTGPKCALRYGPSPDSETMSNWVKSVFLAQPSTEAANSTNIQFSFGPGYFTQKPRIYDFLQLCAYVGATPVLIVPVTLSAADAASLVDYLEDNAGGTTYGAIRQAQGQTAAWVGNGSSPFPFVFLEMGNENWNGLFLGHALFGHANNPNNYFDYGIHIGNQIIAPARARQVAQSYSQSVTKFMANSQTGSTTDLKYLTAFICGQPGYSGGTITCTQGSEDGIEYQQYYATSINGVSTTNCTTGTPNNANCGLYGPTLTETWSDYYDPSSTSGAAQTLTAIKGISSCGPAHTTACLPATYERAIYPTGNANFTQAVSDTFTQAGFHGVADGIAYAEANHNGLAYIAEYASESYALSQGGVNVHIYGAFLDNGGDTSVTNAALFGGNYTPRPQMGAAEVTNYCTIGQEVTTTGTSIPTYNLGTNSNGVHTISNVPNLTFHEYASGAQRCLLINNNDIHNSYTVTLAGTNIPSTVTQYQQAPSSPSVSNETTNLNPVSTIAAAVYPVLTTNVTPGSLPPTSTTAWLWSTSSTSITANFNSRSGGTTVPPNFFGLNCGGISSNSRYDLVGAAGLEHCRIFPDINQDCPAGTCGSWSIPIAEVTDILKNNPGAKVMLDFVNTPSNLGTFTCSPPSNPTTWAGYVNTGITAIKAGVPAGVIDSVEIWNEPDNGTVGGSSGSWCPATGTLLGAYKTFIATAGPIIKSANPTLQVGMPALASTANAVAWFGAGGILGSWSTPDFISYHYYGASTFASWASLLASMQSASTGVGAEFTTIQSILAGQSYAGKIRNTEFNDSYAYSPDCCRFDSTYSLIYNSLNAIDLLNVVNTSGATSLPSLSFYFASEGSSANGFCLWWTLGTANCANGTPPLSASPPYYAYTLMNMLNLPLGGNMATSISPASTLAGLSCSAFYTSQGDAVLCVNPTASAITSAAVTLNNAGITNAVGQQFLLNQSNPGVAQSLLTLTPISGGYTATVNIPAYSAIGMLLSPTMQVKLGHGKYSGGVKIQ